MFKIKVLKGVCWKESYTIEFPLADGKQLPSASEIVDALNEISTREQIPLDCMDIHKSSNPDILFCAAVG